MRRFIIGVAALAFLPAGMLAAQEAGPGVLERLADSEQQRLETEAELATLRMLNQELKRSVDRQPPAPPAQIAEGFDVVGVRQTVLRIINHSAALQKANEERRLIFQTSINRLDKEKDQALEQYRAALRAAEQEKAERARVEWELQQPLDEPAGWHGLIPPTTARALLLALAVGAIGLFAWQFEERLALRRFTRRQGRLGGGVLRFISWTSILAAVSAALFLTWLAFWPDPAYHLSSPDDARRLRVDQAQETIQRNQQRQPELDQEIQKARNEFNSLRAQGLQDWDNLLQLEKEPPPVELHKFEQETADQLRTLFHLAHACDRIAEEAKKQNEQTKRDHNRLEAFARQAPGERQRQTLQHVGIVAATFGFFGLAVCWSRLGRRRAWRRQSRQCPRCLQTKLALTPRADTQMTAPAFDLKCGAAECGYAFPAAVSLLPRIYLPTYGHCASGKTTWLTLASEQLSASDSALGVGVMPIRTDASSKFDDLARQILVEKQPPAPTAPAALPEPLLYHIVDRDALAPSHFLLNLFDFPGETAHWRNVARNDGSYRALSMHGFIFFLDPTGPIELQFQSFVAFCQALRELGGLDVNARLTVPIAVCITKLDRLAETPLQKTALPWFAELRNKERQPLTLGLLQARSDLVRRILPDLFQGFNLAEELDKNYGVSYLFFPQSNFGLQEEELGLPLQQRSALTSFGALEPIWWLLHMNGLQVL